MCGFNSIQEVIYISIAAAMMAAMPSPAFVEAALSTAAPVEGLDDVEPVREVEVPVVGEAVPVGDGAAVAVTLLVTVCF